MHTTILSKENFEETLVTLKKIVNGKNLKVTTDEVDDFDSAIVNPVGPTLVENVFLHKSHDKQLKENFIDSLNNEGEEFNIYLGDKVIIESDTKFSVIANYSENGSNVFKRDDVEVVEQ